MFDVATIGSIFIASFQIDQLRKLGRQAGSVDMELLPSVLLLVSWNVCVAKSGCLDPWRGLLRSPTP